MTSFKPKKSAPNINEVTVLTVSDLHQSRKLYAELAQAVTLHQPDIVAINGDCLHAGDDFQGRLSVEECAQALLALPSKEVIFVRGNHEDETWSQFAGQWRRSKRPLHALNGEVFRFGQMLLIGFPCLLGSEEYFLERREPLPYDTAEWLGPLIRLHGKPARILWLIHEPPIGTVLSQPNCPVEGQPEWRDSIEHYNPLLVVSGHDHITPIRKKRWHCKINNTTCINVGQSNHGPLHFSLIKAKFISSTPSLPTEITVTAFPANETIHIP